MSHNVLGSCLCLKQGSHLLNLLMLFSYTSVSFRLCVKWHSSYSQVICKNQWAMWEYGVLHILLAKKSPWIAHRNKMHWFKKSFRFTNWIKNRFNYHINSKIQLNFLIKISNQLNSPMIKFSNQSNFLINQIFQSN